MSYISDQPDGDWKDFLVGVRKILDKEEHDWAGDEIDRVMRSRETVLADAYQSGVSVKETAHGLLLDLDAWS